MYARLPARFRLTRPWHGAAVPLSLTHPITHTHWDTTTTTIRESPSLSHTPHTLVTSPAPAPLPGKPLPLTHPHTHCDPTTTTITIREAQRGADGAGLCGAPRRARLGLRTLHRGILPSLPFIHQTDVTHVCLYEMKKIK